MIDLDEFPDRFLDEPRTLGVWWIPQIPMKAFRVPVRTIREAMLLTDTLAKYDMFQYENNIKPDYSNAGGIEQLVDGEWEDLGDLEDVYYEWVHSAS